MRPPRRPSKAGSSRRQRLAGTTITSADAGGPSSFSRGACARADWSRSSPEAAGAAARPGPRREREGEQEQDGPSADHPPPPVVDEAAEPLEGRHVRGSWPGARRMAAAVGGIGAGIVVAATDTGSRGLPVPALRPHPIC